MRKENEEQPAGEVTSIFGIYFCQRCRNIITPARANANALEFSCQTCGPQEIDFMRRLNEDALLFTKDHQATYSKKYVFDESQVFDPTLSTIAVPCPECHYEKAIYTIAPDENETKMVARMMCASVAGMVAKCGFTWELRDDDELFEDLVVLHPRTDEPLEDAV